VALVIVAALAGVDVAELSVEVAVEAVRLDVHSTAGRGGVQESTSRSAADRNRLRHTVTSDAGVTLGCDAPQPHFRENPGPGTWPAACDDPSTERNEDTTSSPAPEGQVLEGKRS
jgi:hypothetical protein